MSRILLADDDRVSCKLLGGLLRKWGYEVVIVNDGVDASNELLKDDAPQLAILDWMMPGADGPEVIRAVRSSGHKTYTYILLLTTKGHRGDLLEGMAAGADDYLKKPFDGEELRARVRAGERILDLQAALIQAHEDLRYAAAHDSLTGLWNRGAVVDFLNREISRRERTGDALGVVMCDIDYFKKVNDTYGHLVGDEVLREVTRRLAAGVRPYDVVARYGGEEFLMIFPGCNASTVLVSAERVREAVALRPIDTKRGRISVTISLGICSAEQGDKEPLESETFLRIADEALYAAKAQGRNCLVSAERRVVEQVGGRT